MSNAIDSGFVLATVSLVVFTVAAFAWFFGARAMNWYEIHPKDAIDITLPRDDIRGPVNEMGEPCPWPWDPQQLVGAPLGQYHCGYCGAMVIAGIPHIDYAEIAPMTPAPRNLIRALKARAIIDDDTHPQHAQVVDAVDTALELDPWESVRVIAPNPDMQRTDRDVTAFDHVRIARRNVAAMTLDEFEQACETIGLPVQLPPGTAAGRRP